jgi:hypothetical protein
MSICRARDQTPSRIPLSPHHLWGLPGQESPTGQSTGPVFIVKFFNCYWKQPQKFIYKNAVRSFFFFRQSSFLLSLIRHSLFSLWTSLLKHTVVSTSHGKGCYPRACLGAAPAPLPPSSGSFRDSWHTNVNCKSCCILCSFKTLSPLRKKYIYLPGHQGHLGASYLRDHIYQFTPHNDYTFILT